jgi:hypothetical protein
MRKGGLTAFILPRSFSPLRDGLALAPRRRSRITAAHTRVLQGGKSTTAADRGAFTNGEAPRFEVEASGQAGPRAWALPGR